MYDPYSGVATIGYGQPRRRLRAITNGREIYDDAPSIAPFEPASIANEAADFRQQQQNQIGAQWAINRAKEQSTAPQVNPAIVSLQAQYARRKAPSLARMGNELSINGTAVSSDINRDAIAAGMTPDDFVDSKYKAAQTQFANDNRNRLTGNFQIGTDSSKLFNDPRFAGLSPTEQAELFKQVEGYDLKDALQADSYGSGMTLSQLQNIQAIPQRQKGAFDYFGGIEKATGANAFDILGNYDEATETAMIPGKMVRDPDTGEMVAAPPRPLKIPRALVAQMRQQQAYLSGYGNPKEMGVISEEEELAELEAEKMRESMGPKIYGATGAAANPIGAFLKNSALREKQMKSYYSPAGRQMRAEKREGDAIAFAAKRRAEQIQREREARLLREMQQFQEQENTYIDPYTVAPMYGM